MELMIYLLAGAVTGLLSGLFGVGGGLIIVPILTFLFTLRGFPDMHIMHMALATSFATIILTSFSSVRAHHRKRNVDWSIVRKIVPGIIIGTFLGSLLASQLQTDLLKIIFVVFGFGVAVQLFFNSTPSPHRQLPGMAGISIAGALIGVVSSFIGIGGGTLSVPYLIYCNTAVRSAIGTSAAMGIFLAAAGTLGFVSTGLSAENLPALSAGFVYLPAFAGIAAASMLTAPLGVHLAQRLPTHTLKRMFALLLVTVSISMLWDLI